MNKLRSGLKGLLLLTVLTLGQQSLAMIEASPYCNLNYSIQNQEKACEVGFLSVTDPANHKADCEINYSTTAELKDICVASATVALMNAN